MGSDEWEEVGREVQTPVGGQAEEAAAMESFSRVEGGRQS